MSLSDLTRSYTTFPSQSQTATNSLRFITPIVPSTTAREGPSNIPGYSIGGAGAKGTAVALSSATSTANSGGGSGMNEGLALGLGLGLGISALFAVLAALYIVRSRKAQKVDFEKRAEVIRQTVESGAARPSLN
ncbi:hypothetical protein JCM5353_004624 [Sporobolomyces roseus]